ncbi:MAG: FAD:protein FMN transferase [Pseudomonadota bacterium]
MSNLPTLSRRGFLALPVLLVGCKPGLNVLELAGLTMGTTYNVVVVDEAHGLDEAELRSVIETALAEVNRQLSNWDPASEVSQFNAQQGTDAVPVSGMLAHVMQASEAVHQASLGRFDTTIGPLIELWGFGAQGTNRMPGDAEIALAQQQAGHRNTLSVGASTLQKVRPDSQVYLSAIGKGYGADHVGRAIEALGVTNFMVEIGGDLYASGTNPAGLPWQIGIERPAALSGGVLSVVGVSGLGLASSGDYRNYFERDGERFSHIIDPATGRPITHKTASATVLADNAMLADAWATAMLILGRERGLEIADEHNIAVLFVERDGQSTDIQFNTWSSSQFEALTA